MSYKPWLVTETPGRPSKFIATQTPTTFAKPSIVGLANLLVGCLTTLQLLGRISVTVTTVIPPLLKTSMVTTSQAIWLGAALGVLVAIAMESPHRDWDTQNEAG